MKMIISASELKSSLLGLGKVTHKRATLPVLGCVLFHRNHQGQLQLTGTNLDDYVSRIIDQVEVPVNFKAVIPLPALAKIVSGCGGTALTIEALKEEVRITYSIAGATLTEPIECSKVEEFPKVP